MLAAFSCLKKSYFSTSLWNALLVRILSWQVFCCCSCFSTLKVSARLSSHLHCFQQSDVILIFVLFSQTGFAPSATKIFITDLNTFIMCFLCLEFIELCGSVCFGFDQFWKKFGHYFFKIFFSILLSLPLSNCNM